MHLTLHLTPGCNMRCSYCYSPPRPGQSMTPEVAVRALELEARMTNGSCGIVFFGGEPLLCRELVTETVARARRMEQDGAGRFHFKLTTNGLALDEEILRFSIENNLLIAMSFDGIREAQDAHRRLPDGTGSFDVLLPRLRLLLAARPYASVLMVVNPDTARYLSDSITLLLDLGCRYLIVSLNYAAPWIDSDFRVLRREYRKLASLYVRWTREGRKFYLSPFEVKLSSHINQHCFQKERCELAQRQLSVDPAGFLYPCVQFTRAGSRSDWCIGSVFDGIDESARTRILRASQREKETCRTCAIQKRCNNTCGCLNWQTTGDINSVSPVLCRNEQILIPIVDRVGEKLYRKRSPLFLHKHYNATYPVLSLLEDTLEEKTGTGV